MKWLKSEMLNGGGLFDISASVRHFSVRGRFSPHLRMSLRALAMIIVLAVAASCAKSVGATIDDASITTRVKTVFVNDLTVGVQKIDVDTFRGVVTLSGRADSKETEQKAIELARKVKGVVDVKSTVQIGGLTTPRP